MWFNRTLIGVICIALSGCGFQPLYGTQSNTHVIADFSRIQVAPMADRIGQQLHNRLLRLLHPRGRAKSYLYRLTASLKENTTSLAVKKSAFATRGNLTVTAEFSLLNAATGQSLLSANNAISVSYNIFGSEFETLVAEKDARLRAVNELAEEIRVRLGVYLRDPPKSSLGP